MSWTKQQLPEEAGAKPGGMVAMVPTLSATVVNPESSWASDGIIVGLLDFVLLAGNSCGEQSGS